MAPYHDTGPAPTTWIVTRRATGEVIGEFFDPQNVARFNPATTRVETAGEYLGRLNAEIRAASLRASGKGA